MKQIIYFLLFIIIPISNISSQENKSRFGAEVDFIPWYFDTFSRQTPMFTVSGFIGGYYEHFFSNSISLKTTAGIHNATYKWFENSTYGGKKVRSWQTMLEIKVEPRFYFWDNQQKWGNLFAGLPLSIETGPFQNNPYKDIFQTPTIRAIPIIGYQYYFTNHFFVEANAGLGWRHDSYPTQSSNDLDYLLGLRFGLSF